MKIFLRSLIALAMVFSIGHYASAATYYISNDGADSADGTSTSTPWETVSKLNSINLVPGDVVLLNKGDTFTDAGLDIENSGNSSNDITFSSYGTGSRPLISVSNGNAVTLRNDASHIVIDGIDTYSPTAEAYLLFSNLSDISISNTEVGSSTYGFYLHSSSDIHDLVLDNVAVTESAVRGITVGCPLDGFTVSNSIIEGGEYGIAIGSAATTTDILIDNVEIAGAAQSGVEIFKAEGVVISDSDFHDNEFAGLSLNPSGRMVDIQIEGGSFNNNGDYGILFQGTAADVVISGVEANDNDGEGIGFPSSVVTNFLIEDSEASGNEQGIRLVGTQTGEIRNVTANGNDVGGIAIGGDAEVEVLNAVTSNNLDDGFDVTNDAYVVCDSCISNDNGTDEPGGKGDGFSWHGNSTGIIRNSFASNNLRAAVTHVDSSSVIMYNNVFRHDTTSRDPLIFLLGDGNHQFYNNTVVSDGQDGTAIFDENNSLIKNNIFYGFEFGINESSTSTPDIDYNLFWNTGSDVYSGNAVAGAHDIIADPLFADIDDEDYTLLEGSPAINSGIAISGRSEDKNRDDIVDAPDRGAYESPYEPAAGPEEEIQEEEPRRRGSSGGSSSRKKDDSSKKNDTSKDEDSVTASSPVPCPAGAIYSIETGKPCTQFTVTTVTAVPAFIRDLTLGSVGEDVRSLQRYLNAKGFAIAAAGIGSAGQESDYFGALTKAALIRFQAANGIVPAAGYFGPLTRSFMQMHP